MIYGGHQDGALGFPFQDYNERCIEGLLDMKIMWIPLDDYGIHTQGLEFVNVKFDRLITIEELDEASIYSHFKSELFLKPQFLAGEVLVFDGTVLHRTFE